MSGIFHALCASLNSGGGGPVWTPDGGASGGSPESYSTEEFFPDAAEFTISCSQSAVWVWSSTGTGSLSSTIVSGGSGTAIVFTLTGDFGFLRSRTVTLNSTADGVTKYYSITLTVDGT